MSESTFSQISKLCKEQEIELHRGVKTAGETGRAGIEVLHFQDRAAMAFMRAAYELRKRPEKPLADKIIEYSPEKIQNLGAAVLLNVINTSVEPAEPASPEHAFSCKNAKKVDACTGAENFFAQAVQSLVSEGFGGTIITNNEAEPVFFKKEKGQPSAMTLNEITVNGVVYPAGVIARVDQHGEPIYEKKYFEVKSTDSVKSVGVLRLSEFINDSRQEERSQALGNEEIASMEYFQLAKRLSIEDIAEVCRQAIDKYKQK